jgi:hypothetical protein
MGIGEYFGGGQIAEFWTSSINILSDEREIVSIPYYAGVVVIISDNENFGLSVRCVRD